MLGQSGNLVLGLLLGAVVTFLTRYAIVWVKNRQRRRRLRKALYEEIKSMSDSIDRSAKLLKPVRPEGDAVQIPTDMLVTTVYERNADRLGVLSDREVEALTDFYSQCEVVRRVLNDFAEKDEIQPGSVQLLRKNAIELQGKMVDSLNYLEEELDIPPNQRVRKFDRMDLIDLEDEQHPTRESLISTEDLNAE